MVTWVHSSTESLIYLQNIEPAETKKQTKTKEREENDKLLTFCHTDVYRYLTKYPVAIYNLRYPTKVSSTNVGEAYTPPLCNISFYIDRN